MNFRSLKKEVKIFDLFKFQSLSYVYRAVILFDETELYAYFIDITLRRERTQYYQKNNEQSSVPPFCIFMTLFFCMVKRPIINIFNDNNTLLL